MSVAYLLDFPGTSLEQYDAVCADLGLRPGAVPEGLIYHAAGHTETGLRVLDVWESDEHFAAFREPRLMPATQAHGLPAPQVERIEVAQTRLGEGEGLDARLLQVVRMDGLDGPGFRALDREVLPDGKAPAGCGFHVNGGAEGGWVVIDTWTSAAIHDAFIAERVAPTMQAAGRTEPPVIEVMEIHAILSPQELPVTH